MIPALETPISHYPVSGRYNLAGMYRWSNRMWKLFIGRCFICQRCRGGPRFSGPLISSTISGVPATIGLLSVLLKSNKCVCTMIYVNAWKEHITCAREGETRNDPWLWECTFTRLNRCDYLKTANKKGLSEKLAGGIWQQGMIIASLGNAYKTYDGKTAPAVHKQGHLLRSRRWREPEGA